jgi:septum formation protein
MIWLASTSPRRRELLALLGVSFHTLAPAVDEMPMRGEAVEDYPLRLATAKAEAGARLNGKSARLIVAADTTVAVDGALLGKPEDAQEARQMLLRLRGRVHFVISGVAVLEPASETTLAERCISSVPMRCYTDSEIEAYIATGDSLDKAGSYAIQHAGFHPVEGFNGCFANVMGLPLCHLTRMLRRLDVLINVDTAAVCQQTLGYTCKIYTRVLAGEAIG